MLGTDDRRAGECSAAFCVGGAGTGSYVDLFPGCPVAGAPSSNGTITDPLPFNQWVATAHVTSPVSPQHPLHRTATPRTQPWTPARALHLSLAEAELWPAAPAPGSGSPNAASTQEITPTPLLLTGVFAHGHGRRARFPSRSMHVVSRYRAGTARESGHVRRAPYACPGGSSAPQLGCGSGNQARSKYCARDFLLYCR